MSKETKKPGKETKPVETKTQAAPDNAFDWGAEQATGFEGTRAEDLGIPFISLLQKGSPEVDQDHKEYETKGIEGAEAGMVINTVTREILYGKDENDPLLFVPAFHEKLFQEWKPRNSGGGFVQSHRNATILTKTSRSQKNEDVLPNGNIIITTSYFYGFARVNGEWVRAILPMTSTQLKKARGWLNTMHGIRLNGVMPPMFSHSYALTTVKESNEKGNWWGWKIETYATLTRDDMPVIQEARKIALECSQQKQLPATSTAESEVEDTEVMPPEDDGRPDSVMEASAASSPKQRR